MLAKAATFKGPGIGFEIVELPLRETEPGGILVKNTSASICGSDLHGWRGDSGVPFNRPPTISGHEFTGVVARIGKGGEHDSLRNVLKEGDRITFPFFFPCNSCYHCIRGQLNVCPFRTRPCLKGIEEYPYADGGYSEYFYLQQGAYKFKTPDELKDSAVTPVNCALSQVLFAMDLAGVNFGDVVVIQGAGGLGLYATALASDMGASQVIVIDGHQNRLDMAIKCGATKIVNISQFPTPAERIELVHHITNGIGADIVIEVVGVPSATCEGLDMVRKGGKYIDIGNISGGDITIPANKVIVKQIKWFGVQHYNPWILPVALDFLVRTKNIYPLSDMVVSSFNMEDINKAFEHAEWQGKESGSPSLRTIINL